MNDGAVQAAGPRPRYALLDEVRGLALLSMMGYHAMWDMVYLFGLDAPWYSGAASLVWQQLTSWVFILLSGFACGWGGTPSGGGCWSSEPGRWSRR